MRLGSAGEKGGRKRANLTGKKQNPSLTAKSPLHASWFSFLIWSKISPGLTPLTMSQSNKSKPKATWDSSLGLLGKVRSSMRGEEPGGLAPALKGLRPVHQHSKTVPRDPESDRREVSFLLRQTVLSPEFFHQASPLVHKVLCLDRV